MNIYGNLLNSRYYPLPIPAALWLHIDDIFTPLILRLQTEGQKLYLQKCKNMQSVKIE